MGQLAIAVLGSFQVTHAGQPVTNFQTDSARALLAYVVMHAGTSFQREALATLLWPEQSTPKALNALRQTLNRLRIALEDETGVQPYLQVSRSTVQFNLGDHFWLDATAFINFVTGVKQHSHRHLEHCQICLRHLQKAATLYRGDFLADLSMNSLPFQDWLTTQREQFHNQAIEILDYLMDHFVQYDAYDEVHSIARRQLALEPWHEKTYRQLMQTLAWNGQRNDALIQYEKCCHILADELNAEPSVETTALFEQIRSGDLEQPSPSQTNLPLNLTTFIGRDRELAQIAENLQRRDCRLLTLVGLGGMGKSRVAVQVAQNVLRMYRDGVHFVPLAALTSPDQVITAIAHALQFTFDSKQSEIVQLCNYLREKDMLLVLDSFEHVLTAATLLTELLRYAPNVQALVTSRERLNVQIEWVYEISGLTYPSENAQETSATWDAVQLFTQTASRAQPDFAADEQDVIHICRLVDGIPLAIELAAAWVRVLSCHEIVQEIQRDLGFLQTSQGDMPERHRNLRVMFDSAWALLASNERNVLCQISVFRGGFDREAASQVGNVSLSSLVALRDKLWLRQEGHRASSAVARYEMHDLVQRYLIEQLAKDPEAEIHARDCHCHYYFVWLQQFKAKLKDSAQRTALEEIGNEIGNIRAAWDWAIDHRRVAEIDSAWESLFIFFDLKSWFQEGAAAFGKMVQAFQDAHVQSEKGLLGCALACQGWWTYRIGSTSQARELFEQGIGILRATGLRRETALALSRLGMVLLNLGMYAKASSLCEESLSIFQELNDKYNVAMVLNYLGQIAQQQGDFSEAQQRCRASLDLARECGARQIEADSLHQIGVTYFAAGRIIETQSYNEQALSCYREITNPWGEADTLVTLAGSYSRQGDKAKSQLYLKQALQISQRIGDQQVRARALNGLGNLAVDQRNYAQGQEYFRRALLIARDMNDQKTESGVLSNLGIVAYYQGDWSNAKTYHEQALQVRRAIGDTPGEVFLLDHLGLLAMEQGDFENARLCLEKSLSVSLEIGGQTSACYVLLHLGELSRHQGDNTTAKRYGQQALHLTREIAGPFEQAWALTDLGHALTGLDCFSEAASAYREAFDLYRELGHPQRATEPLAGLAYVFLTQGDLMQAQVCITDVLNHLETDSLEGTDDPIRVYLTCYQVLCANHDPRAQDVLIAGRAYLQARAAKPGTKELRRSLLSNIPSHRELLSEWAKFGEIKKQS